MEHETAQQWAVIALAPKGSTCIADVFATEAEAEAQAAIETAKRPLWTWIVYQVVEIGQ